MKYKNKLLSLAVLAMSVVGMASCGGGGKCDGVSTPITDATEIRTSYEGKNFIDDGIGLVTNISMCVDGDTTILFVRNRSNAEEKITIRYVAIDTPESTGEMEAWGKPASLYNASKLENAEKIVVDCERNIYDKIDGNGRYLGMVWYQPKGETKLRNLNLELVELGYSKNYHYEPDSAYYKAFQKAGKAAERCGLRVYGQVDPDFDYSNAVYEGLTVAKIYSMYDEITAKSGTIIHVKGVVIGLMGDSFVLRDLEPNESGAYPSIYCFPGYGSSLATLIKVGFVISFYASASEFLDNPQLANINTKLTGARKMEIFNEFDEEKGEYIPFTGPTVDYPNLSLEPSVIDQTTITKAGLADYAYQFVKTNLTIREIELGQTDSDGNIIPGTEYTGYFRKDEKGNITVYSQLRAGVVLNMRINSDLNPKPTELLFEVGKTYTVTAFMQPYYENYQLMLFNNTASMNYIVPVV